MVHPNTPLADFRTIRAWAWANQRDWSIDTLWAYRTYTGRGISDATLTELGIRLPETREALGSNAPDPSFDAEIGHDKLVALNERAINNNSPSMLNRLMPEALQIADRYHIPLPPDFVADWVGLIEKMENSGEVALHLANRARPCDAKNVPDWSLEEAVRTRNPSILAQWGNAAIEAAHYSRADMLLALGLEDLVNDALVRARDLARR